MVVWAVRIDCGFLVRKAWIINAKALLAEFQSTMAVMDLGEERVVVVLVVERRDDQTNDQDQDQTTRQPRSIPIHSILS